jgi:hypothetical protein
MDGLCTWLTRYHRQQVFNGGDGSLPTMEAIETGTAPLVAITFDKKTQTESELQAWLSNSPAPSVSGLVSRMRLVWLPMFTRDNAARRDWGLRPWLLAVRQGHLNCVLAAFKIRLAFEYSFTNHTGYTILREGIGTNNRSTSFCIFRRNTFVVAWAQDTQSKITKAVITARPHRRTRLEEVMDHQRNLAAHPLFLALVVAMWEGTYVEDCLIDSDTEITQIENRTGYHPWAMDDGYETAEGDYSSLSAKTSGASTSLAVLRMNIKFLRGLLAWIGEMNKTFSQQGDTLLDCIAMIGARLDQQEMLVGFLQDRANNQMTVLFNLITSQDARTGIEIARDSRTLAVASKLDSSSMKTLAAVSVLFLPGTFVSSFFSMPLFDYQNNTMVVSNKIWMYWIVTIPLTIITILIWYLWIRHKRMLINNADQPRRDTESRWKMRVIYAKASP